MIYNKTKNILLAKEKRILTSIFSKAIGLMFSRKIRDKGLIFVFDKPQKISLHMFFVFYPIDVIFLDENKKIIEIKENFMPFTLYNTKNKCKYIIELPGNIIKKSRTEINDLISF